MSAPVTDAPRVWDDLAGAAVCTGEGCTDVVTSEPCRWHQPSAWLEAMGRDPAAPEVPAQWWRELAHRGALRLEDAAGWRWVGVQRDRLNRWRLAGAAGRGEVTTDRLAVVLAALALAGMVAR